MIMDKKAIKTFAIDARKKLISEIKYKANLLGITADGIAEPIKESDGMEVYNIGGSTPYTIYDEAINQRKDLVQQVKEKGFDNVVEEVAYTWFNRILAIRFMEVNDYLPTRVRVLSSETEGKIEPDIVTESHNMDLSLSDEEIEKIYLLKSENKLDELFRLLFIKQCNKLNEILPELFEQTSDYTESLLSISFTNEDGVVRQLIDNISEEDFTDQVEIIGWLYQYYNTELKEDTFKQLKKRVKISKERIPAATQLFTPDWIVRYMVENSLGRLWLNAHPDSNLKINWKYYLDEAEQEPEVRVELSKIRENAKDLKPKDIKIIDPAMGSGHILVYAFDVLMQIYTSVGYSERDAAAYILKYNLYGLDIDERAYQLAYFAVMMKARSYNRRILTKNIDPQLCAFKESNFVSNELINFIGDDDLKLKRDLKYIKETFTDAKEYGSILNVSTIDFTNAFSYVNKIKIKDYSDLNSLRYKNEAIQNFPNLIKQANILSMQYHVVITNPPYMGSKSMGKTLSKYLKIHYPGSKSDFFAVFIEKCLNMLRRDGFLAMITQHAFMFLTSYEKLRNKIFQKNIVNMAHLGTRAFEDIGGEVVQTTSFVFQNNSINSYKSKYLDLVPYNSQKSKEKAFLDKKNTYLNNQENFKKIPRSFMAYWISEDIINLFDSSKKLADFAELKVGIQTGDTKRFLKFWHEIDINKCGFGFENLSEARESHLKWFPYNKGGSFRKWYGNYEYVVNWENDGYEIKNFYDNRGKLRSRPQNTSYSFKEALTWSALSSGQICLRYSPKGFLYDVKGPFCYVKDRDYTQYILGLLNSKVTHIFLEILSPTLDFNPGDLANIPFIYSQNNEIDCLVSENIDICKNEWDSYERSWEYKTHPFIKHQQNSSLIEKSFQRWCFFTQNENIRLNNNEFKLNEIFIEIYGLNKLDPHVEDKYLSTTIATAKKSVINFISYAVGCMLGRYSLDKEGLIFAGGIWDFSKYSKFLPDEDNIIPILDSEYFEDDIVGRFVEFVKVTFGQDNLEENLDFIASELKKKGSTSREIIRNYFLTDFYKDHIKTYKKHPIYWLFDSGKNNGFKALIYMHRYEPDLVARVRTDYLHKIQKALETTIAHNDMIINNSTSASEKSKAVKSKDKLIKQLEETRRYDIALAHVANQKIEIDLDDGVKVNYSKFQRVEVSNEGKKVIKINLLKKI